MTRRCNYTVMSDGEVIARFSMFTDIEFFMQQANEIDLFGKTGAVAYKPNGDFISECKPKHRRGK